MNKHFQWATVAAMAMLSASCGSSSPNTPTPTPPPPPIAEPAITCPANISVTTAQPTAVVTYTAPVATGGTPPTTTTCTVASGASFPVGTSTVSCTLADSIGRSAVCGFTVTVTLRVYLKYTSFWAFGDSVTAGEVSVATFSAQRFLDPTNNYPTVLRGLLSDRYTQQSISVGNHGVPGERADDGADRLRAELIAGPLPDVLLLMEGYNEMTSQNDDLVDTIVPTLSVDIDEARRRGVKAVALATLPPARSGRLGTLILPYLDSVNAQIRALASSKGVLLVDLNAAMTGQQATLIGDDGLHPTVAGYRKIAETFASTLKTAWESGTAPTLGGIRR